MHKSPKVSTIILRRIEALEWNRHAENVGATFRRGRVTEARFIRGTWQATLANDLDIIAALRESICSRELLPTDNEATDAARVSLVNLLGRIERDIRPAAGAAA